MCSLNDIKTKSANKIGPTLCQRRANGQSANIATTAYQLLANFSLNIIFLLFFYLFCFVAMHFGNVTFYGD